VGPFEIKNLHGKNAVEVYLTGEIEKKHHTFPVGGIKYRKPTIRNQSLFPKKFLHQRAPKGVK
jgi:hypothetical protein